MLPERVVCQRCKNEWVLTDEERKQKDFACPDCRVIAYPAKPTAVVDKNQTNNEKPPMTMGAKIGCTSMSAIVLILIVFAVYSDCNRIGIPTDTYVVGESEAYIMSQVFVRERLAAPATADFPWQALSVQKRPNNEWFIRSYVDAQNSFGANIRTHYTCNLQYLGGDWMYPTNWKVRDIQLSE